MTIPPFHRRRLGAALAALLVLHAAPALAGGPDPAPDGGASGPDPAPQVVQEAPAPVPQPVVPVLPVPAPAAAAPADEPPAADVPAPAATPASGTAPVDRRRGAPGGAPGAPDARGGPPRRATARGRRARGGAPGGPSAGTARAAGAGARGRRHAGGRRHRRQPRRRRPCAARPGRRRRAGARPGRAGGAGRMRALLIAVLILLGTAAPAMAQPEIDVTCNGTECLSDWYRTAVRVDWAVAGGAPTAGCSDVTLTADTAGTEQGCIVRDGGGATASLDDPAQDRPHGAHRHRRRRVAPARPRRLVQRPGRRALLGRGRPVRPRLVHAPAATPAPTPPRRASPAPARTSPATAAPRSPSPSATTRRPRPRRASPPTRATGPCGCRSRRARPPGSSARPVWAARRNRCWSARPAAR